MTPGSDSRPRRQEVDHRVSRTRTVTAGREIERRVGRLRHRTAETVSCFNFVILDELRDLPFARSGGQLLFLMVSLDFAEWPKVFADPKMTTDLLDQLTRHCEVIEPANETWAFKQRD